MAFGILISFTFLMVVPSNSFNLDDRFFLKIKEKRHQYFGYSIGFRNDSNQYKILVGAPKANDTRFLSESGALYECNVSQPHDCRMVNLSIPSRLNTTKENQWLGVALDISPSNSRIIVCAHRFKEHHTSMDSLVGACYEMNSLTAPVSTTLRHHDVFNQLFGTSCRYSQKGSLLIGAPGFPINTLGGGYDFNGNFIQDIDYDSSAGYSVTFLDEFPIIGKPKYKYYGAVSLHGDEFVAGPETKYTFGSYFGSAIAAADLNLDGSPDLVIGAPFYSETFAEEGRVYIYFYDTSKPGFYEHANIVLKEPSYRSQFGKSLLTGNINSDRYQDVIVGAPYEHDGSGCIYVYNGKDKGVESAYSQKINGESLHNGLKSFGISFTRSVDLDQNGYADIGVGAYLSDYVFIFKARPTYSVTAHLVASERSLNMQPNCKLNDLPVICINLTVTLTVSTSSEMEYNLRLLTDTSKIPDEKRTYINGLLHEIQELVTVRPPTFQKVYQIVIKNTMDIMSPINFTLHYSLNDQGYSKKCKSLCPIAKNGTLTELVKFNLDCGSDEICQTRLKVELQSFPPNITLGREEKLRAIINVFNMGEYAYNAIARVFFSPLLEFELVEQPANGTVECTAVDDMELFCFLGNPIKENSTKPFLLHFLIGLTTNITKVFVAVNVSTDSQVEAIYMNNTVNLTINFLRESKLELGGNSIPDTLALKRENGLMTAKHVYQLRNNGPSNAFGLIFSVDIPHFVINNSPLMDITEYRMYGENGIISNESVCHLKKLQGTAAEFQTDLKSLIKHINIANCSWLKCHRIDCTLSALTTTDTKYFEIALNIDTKILKQFQNKLRAFSIVSNGTLGMTTTQQMINVHQDHSKATTTFLINRLQKKIQWWIVVASIIIGLIFLIILGVILWKLGFFTRNRITAEERQRLAVSAEKSDSTSPDKDNAKEN